MRKLVSSLVLLCCCTSFLGSLASAQDSSKSATDMAAMMKQWKDLTSPGDHHKMFSDAVGTWTTETSLWMGPPPTPPKVAKGTAEFTLLHDGRFLKQELRGEMMGGPYTGTGITGYDNMKKCYEMFWIDNLTTAFSMAEGNYDMSGKFLNMYGKMDEPMTGERNKNVKYVLHKIDDNKFIFEIHDLSLTEPNTKIVEIVYTRAK